MHWMLLSLIYNHHTKIFLKKKENYDDLDHEIPSFDQHDALKLLLIALREYI
jgi:hypothetical protein